MEVTGELVRICDHVGRPRGSGFVADDRGTVLTGHDVVAGLERLVLHGPGPDARPCAVEAADVLPLPSAGLALVRTDGLEARPLPVTVREPLRAGRYVRLAARGWRQARVLGPAPSGPGPSCPVQIALALGTDGTDALRLGGEARGGPVLDAETGAVLAVLGGVGQVDPYGPGLAVVLRRAAAADPDGPLAELLARNAATVPAHGADLNLAGALQLTGATLPAAPPGDQDGPEPVERAAVTEELTAFAGSGRLVTALVGAPGTGRTSELAALARRRTLGPAPAPTLWLRGVDLHADDASLGDAAARAVAEAERRPVGGPPLPSAAAEPGAGRTTVERIAALARAAGRPLTVLLDAPEEMPPQLAHRLAAWTEASVDWLRAGGIQWVTGCRPEFWERVGAACPPDVLHRPARPAPQLPPAVRLGDLGPDEAATARARYGIPDGAVRAADARHPLTLRLLSGIRAAGVTQGRPGRAEVFAAHLDLMCLRVAVRIAAGGAAPVHAPGVRRLAARVAGRLHEAARRCLGPGQGELDRASFEELFPRRTGWACAVLTEGLLVPAGAGYRIAHEELSDWLQAGHLDVPTALDSLVHRRLPAAALPVPRHRVGPVVEALLQLPPQVLAGRLADLLAVVAAPAGSRAAAADDDRLWWATRLLREVLLRTGDALPYLEVLEGLADHVAQAGPGEFGGSFLNRLRLPEPVRLDLLRRVLPADPPPPESAGPAGHPAADRSLPADRYLDAARRRLVRDPRRVQPLLVAWFGDERTLRGRPGATVATAAQALLHTHRALAPDDLAEALVAAAHPRADELLAVLAEEEPTAVCRAVHRWAHDERADRRVAAAAYALAAAPHVRTPADRELLRHCAQRLLARPGDTALHGSALAVLLRDPQVRGHYLRQALHCFRHGTSRLPAEALVTALPLLPDPDGVFEALRARADGEVLRALAGLTTPALARRAAELVREHLARHPEDAPHAAFFVDRRLDHGPAARGVLLPLVAELLRGPAVVRTALAGVLAAPGAEASWDLRGELAVVLLAAEEDPGVLDAALGALAHGAGACPPERTRQLLRRTGRQLLRAPGGPELLERRTVELAAAAPEFRALLAHWVAEDAGQAAALLGPAARRMVETLTGRGTGPGTLDVTLA
ncbi:serine protease [Streptomyces antimicrobicus]|uniref:Serine protease n=1 Tax=Streptomyces antimicrobicus TaxID=2883108 RepID=A0ABS8BEZ9_9ACTN|nr:serine protease [Streptomyces antimicrobicus]MCB5183098.1 serine protease [Streptomyces antimicrobicus]